MLRITDDREATAHSRDHHRVLASMGRADSVASPVCDDETLGVRLGQSAGMSHERQVPTYPSSTASDDERSRYASTCASRSLAFCSTVSTASAPATQRGGCSSTTTLTRTFASFAGSPPC